MGLTKSQAPFEGQKEGGRSQQQSHLYQGGTAISEQRAYIALRIPFISRKKEEGSSRNSRTKGREWVKLKRGEGERGFH